MPSAVAEHGPSALCCNITADLSPFALTQAADGINLGLDFEAALVDPAQVEFVTSPQLIIQLKRFNTAVKKALAVKAAAPPAAGGAAAGMGGAPLGGAAGAAARGRGRGAPLDLDSIMGSSSSDKADVDTSIPGALARQNCRACCCLSACACTIQRCTSERTTYPAGDNASQLIPYSLCPAPRYHQARGTGPGHGCGAGRGPLLPWPGVHVPQSVEFFRVSNSVGWLLLVRC